MGKNKKTLNRWTLCVNDFGKIKDAKITISPLTLFVGDNNSGKSYLMILIYGLLNAKFYFDGFKFDKTSENFLKCKNIINLLLNNVNDEYKLNRDDVVHFQNFLTEILETNKEEFIANLFNKSISIGKLSVHFPNDSSFSFAIQKLAHEEKDKKQTFEIKTMDIEKPIIYSASYSYEELTKDDTVYFFFISYILETMLNPFFCSGKMSKVYLPTARTGFLLTYKSIVKKALQDSLSASEPEKNPLSKPCSDFLQTLSTMQTESQYARFSDVLDMLENNVITGKLTVSNQPPHDISYIPAQTSTPLPLHVTSGVVTEVTPLALFLKYVDMAMLMIEEPEISLHPRLQKEIAKCLIRIVNKDTPVFVTTHSDIILQQINNMIRLNDFKDDDGVLKYGEDDLLSRNDVSVYQFDVENGKTTIKSIPCGDYGFAVLSFYDALKEMNDEINTINSLDKSDA
ncbi:MAG: AAA family ATPase [Treponemataceae bacterium]|nr:AAA family ATPase [Treponemataceae bacterium]